MSCVPSLTRHSDTSMLGPYNGYQYYVPYCGKDWEMFNGKCYYFEYKELNCEAAQASCLEKGGYLADIEDDAENALFVTLSQRGSFWVGGKMEDGTWIWQDGTPLTLKYWGDGEPNGGSCVQLRQAIQSLDATTGSKSKYSLCEK